MSAWGILRKQVNKGLSGVFNASVVLSASRLARLTLSGSVTSSGALRKQVAIYHAGVLSTAGGIRKAVQTALSGVLSSIGQLLASVVGTSVIMDGFDVRETRASIILDSSPAWPMLYETRQNPLYYETRENLMLDVALESKLNTEISDRKTADQELESKINAEAAARTAQDEVLHQQRL